jgi:Fe2+ or Zn2+ uptake regulation protein
MPDFTSLRSSSPRRPCATAMLRVAGLRPTRQRVALAELLFTGPHRHVSAEQLHGEASASKVNVSLATIYNTLHQFQEAGLLREVAVDASRSYFDTDTSDRRFHRDPEPADSARRHGRHSCRCGGAGEKGVCAGLSFLQQLVALPVGFTPGLFGGPGRFGIA